MTMIPHTQYERLMLLEELERGEKVVLPVSYEHAEVMLRVASMYIQEHHTATMAALTKDYS
jgi:hypothetical protein